MTGPAPRGPRADRGPDARAVRQRGLIGLVALLALIGVLAGFSWVVIIVVLMATLFLHELGHYVTARLTGMRVDEFFIGFGPRIWSFRRGGTEYGIKSVWLGAYVRIVGMNNLEVVAPEEERHTFRQKSYPKKLLVLTAGSGVHFMIALALLFVLLLADGSIASVGGDPALEEQDWTLQTVSVQSAASAAGLQPGDELVSIGGVATGTFAEFSMQVRELAGAEVEVVYLRDGARRTALARVRERLTREGAAGIVGLLWGDRILAVEGLASDGAPAYSEIAAFASGRLGEPLDITIVDARSGEPAVVEGAIISQTVSPSQAVDGFFGVSADYGRQGLAAGRAAYESLRFFGTIVREVVFALPNIVTDGIVGSVEGLRGAEPAPSSAGSARELELRRLDSSHPDEHRILSIFGVARLGAEAASDGAADVVILLVFVNIFIGVFNLLPLPPLDGGHVAVVTYERLRSIGGRSYHVDASSLVPLTYAVVVLLLLIGGVALVRDILDPVTLR